MTTLFYDLHDNLLKDIKALEIRLDFCLELKSFSKSYRGRYFIRTQKVVLYVFEDKSCITLRPYKEILKSCIHEVVHHLQYTDRCYKRIKGIMHNEAFWGLYEHYHDLAQSSGLLERRCHTIDNQKIELETSEGSCK